MPIVAHDMLSRFTSTDYLSAAGDAASVPSRVGNEEAAIVGETHPNGTAIDEQSLNSDALGEDGLRKVGEEPTGSPMSDAYYNIGAALLVLFVSIALGSCFIYRQRKRRRSVFSLPVSLSNGGSNHTGQHRRSGSTKTMRKSGSLNNVFGDAGNQTAEGAEEETNELLPMHERQRKVERSEEIFDIGEEEDEEEEDLNKKKDLDSDEEGNLGAPGRKFSD